MGQAVLPCDKSTWSLKEEAAVIRWSTVHVLHMDRFEIETHTHKVGFLNSSKGADLSQLRKDWAFLNCGV